MTPESLPLTPHMREALLAHRARNNRLIGWVLLALTLIFGIVLSYVLSSARDSALDAAIFGAILLGPFVGIAAILFWANNSRARRALADGNYRRYEGSPRAGYSSGGSNNTLTLGSDSMLLNRPTAATAAIFEHERVTVVYSVAAREIFAIWDGMGRVIHHLHSYDPHDDGRVAGFGWDQRVTGERPPSQDDVLATESGQAQRHSVVPGQYPLTPQMLERLKPSGGWSWVASTFVLGFGAFGGFLHYAGAPWYSFAPMYIIALLVLAMQFEGWWGGKRVYAKARAGGTYTRHRGFYILEPYGRTATAIHWRIRVLDSVLPLPSDFEHDPAWLVDSHPRGTLVYSPDAGELFAVWDDAGRLVYRNRHYNLGDDALVVAPAPE